VSRSSSVLGSTTSHFHNVHLSWMPSPGLLLDDSSYWRETADTGHTCIASPTPAQAQLHLHLLTRTDGLALDGLPDLVGGDWQQSICQRSWEVDRWSRVRIQHQRRRLNIDDQLHADYSDTGRPLSRRLLLPIFGFSDWMLPSSSSSSSISGVMHSQIPGFRRSHLWGGILGRAQK